MSSDERSGPTETTVSTHILDTAAGRPAPGVEVELAVREGSGGEWKRQGLSRTDSDGRCKDLPALPEPATDVRLTFATGPYLQSRDIDDRARSAAFFPEVAVVFTAARGEHHHVPLLLSPFGYSVYRGS